MTFWAPTAVIAAALYQQPLTAAPSASPPAGAPNPAVVGDPVTLPTDDAITPTDVPAEAVREPASLSHRNKRIARTAKDYDIPAEAVAAYQRAEVVINHSDDQCRLDWTLLAGIGRVESDHGRHAGSRLDSDGVATPAIIGLRLDGSAGTSVIRDTDGGELDGDSRFDRAVGPMQFIPSTWALVGVDADDDGQRDPQDVDDAALAAAVYLCSGRGELDTTAGAEEALLRYNNSLAYVDLVRSFADAYADGDYDAGDDGSGDSDDGDGYDDGDDGDAGDDGYDDGDGSDYDGDGSGNDQDGDGLTLQGEYSEPTPEQVIPRGQVPGDPVGPIDPPEDRGGKDDGDDQDDSEETAQPPRADKPDGAPSPSEDSDPSPSPEQPSEDSDVDDDEVPESRIDDPSWPRTSEDLPWGTEDAAEFCATEGYVDDPELILDTTLLGVAEIDPATVDSYDICTAALTVDATLVDDLPPLPWPTTTTD